MLPRSLPRPQGLAALLAVLGVLGAAGHGAAASIPDPDAEGLTTSQRLDALLERIKYEQGQLESLEADFVQRKESQLFLEPEKSLGSFSYRAPDRVLWKFDEPDATTISIDGQTMLTWYRDLGRAEKVDVGKQATRIFQFLGAANSLSTLQKYFTVRVTFPRDTAKPYKLELEPRFERVARRLRGMVLELDRQKFVPVRIHYTEPDGDTTELVFDDIQVNREIPDGHFELDLPADVDITEIDAGP